MDQKYCVGYSKNESGGSDQLHDRTGSRETGRPVKRNGTPGQAKQDALCLLIICSRLFFGFVNTLPHWSGGRKHSNWWIHRSVASQTPSGDDAQSFRHSSAVPSQADHAFLYNAARWVSVAATETRRQRTRSSSRCSGKTFKHSLHLLAGPFCATKPSGTCSGCSSLTRTAAVHTHRWKMSWWRPRW